MWLVIYLRDGRTAYLLRGRKALRVLLGLDPGNEERGVKVVRGIWNPERGEYLWAMEPVELRFLGRSSISVIERGHPELVAAVADPVLGAQRSAGEELAEVRP
jgi:hypothetical protein